MPFVLDDVARLTGVSTATVPYVINDGLRSGARETQRRVLRAVSKPHCLPGAIGRSLLPRKTDFISFILPDIPKPIHRAMARALGKAIEAAHRSFAIRNCEKEPDGRTRLPGKGREQESR